MRVERTDPPALGQRLGGWISRNDWEALVGGNILNKIGALVLVVGIALFSGYSFHRIGPAGRASAAVAASLAMLGAGVWLERRAVYSKFARGLIGAGWAALYATSYAIYALPAARVIESATTGSILQMAVAALMVLHSLRYRSETVTSLAYFSAFLALAVTPTTPFAVLGLVPLSVSLLYLAHRFHWHRMALAGLIATYVTCAVRGGSDAPLWTIQTLFLVYWIAFEGFDLLRVRDRLTGRSLAWIFPLNAMGFIGLSYLAWSGRRSEDLWMMAAVAAALYAVSALVRVMICRPSGLAADDLASRLSKGSFEGALTIAALMAGMAIFGHGQGVWRSLVLVAEAELFYLAALQFRWRPLKFLGYAGFLASLGAALMDNAFGRVQSEVFGHAIPIWTTAAAFHAALFYLNRYLEPRDKAFSYIASYLVVGIINAESPAGYAGLLWITIGCLLFEVGWRWSAADLRWQGAAMVGVGSLRLVAQYGGILSRFDAPVWISLTAGGALAWSVAVRVLFSPNSSVHEWEKKIIRDGATTAGSALLMMAAVVLVPGAMVTAVWFAGSCAVLQMGRVFQIPWFWVLAQAIMGGAFCRFATIDAPQGRDLYLPAWAAAAMIFQWLGARRGRIDLRILSHSIAILTLARGLVHAASSKDAGQLAQSALLTTIAVFYAMQFLTGPREASSSNWFGRIEGAGRLLFALYGTMLLSAFLRAQVSGKVLTMAWGLQGLVLLAAGFPLRDRTLRLPGLALLLICVCKLFLYDLRNLESLFRTLSFVGLGVILLGVSWIYTRYRDRLRQYF